MVGIGSAPETSGSARHAAARLIFYRGFYAVQVTRGLHNANNEFRYAAKVQILQGAMRFFTNATESRCERGRGCGPEKLAMRRHVTTAAYTISPHPSVRQHIIATDHCITYIAVWCVFIGVRLSRRFVL